MALLIDVASWTLLVAGGVLCVIGGIGLLRFPDFYSRVHASGIIDTAGAGFVLLGLMLQAGVSQVTIKLAYVLFIVLITSPTAAHAIVHAAHARGLMPWTTDETETQPSAPSST